MNTEEQITQYLTSLAPAKRVDMESLHQQVLSLLPGKQLWFDNGKNAENKTVTNPTIGYGAYTIHYANGKSKENFQAGISANATGISVYILGLKDKTYLPKTYGKTIGNASVTGYCIKFKSLKDINVEVLKEAILNGSKLVDSQEINL